MLSDTSSYDSLPEASLQALAELTDRAHSDPAIIALILSGSAARGMATQHSDIDVIVVRDEENGAAAREVQYSSAIDEIPMTLAELETIKPVGSEGAWVRWSFAWAKIIYDTSDGRVAAAVKRQAVLSEQEVKDLLIGRSRLDEYINFTYRALKSHRDGKPDAARLDSAESVASLLDVVFALEGRVRPYNKYLAWEIREHPLIRLSENWDGDGLIRSVEGLLDGRENAVREVFAEVEKECRAYDLRTEQEMLSKVIDDWGDELLLLRSPPAEDELSK